MEVFVTIGVKLIISFFGLALWCALSYFFENATTHFVRFGYMAEGRTVLLIDKGRLLNESMRSIARMEHSTLFRWERKNVVRPGINHTIIFGIRAERGFFYVYKSLFFAWGKNLYCLPGLESKTRMEWISLNISYKYSDNNKMDIYCLC